MSEAAGADLAARHRAGGGGDGGSGRSHAAGMGGGHAQRGGGQLLPGPGENKADT